MGSLTTYLQREIPKRLPSGWACDTEARLLGNDVTQLLGYDPRADVVLIHAGTDARVWIEFEVSRADPVANHAKFATAHLFVPQRPADHFVAMLSPHIDRGRRNLAAATIRLMRRVGMSAFQTTLLPLATPDEVKRLNQLPVNALATEHVDVAAEVERVLAVVTPWGAGDVLTCTSQATCSTCSSISEDGTRNCEQQTGELLGGSGPARTSSSTPPPDSSLRPSFAHIPRSVRLATARVPPPTRTE